MLTANNIILCREYLAEHKAKQLESSLGTKTRRGEIKRYWGGIPEPMHDAVLEYLSMYVSAANLDVVRITNGDVDCSVPGVLGDYVWNNTIANGQPVRTNGEFFLKAVHYEAASNFWQWAIVDNNNMILLLTDLVEGFITHWADDGDEWKDEWAFEDEQGVLEPSGPLPTVPTVFNPQTLTMVSADDNLMVNEYGWIVDDEAATYTVTGDIVLETVAATDAVYGMVKAPLVDGHARSGTWSAGDAELVKTDGKRNANEGDWIVVQTLWREPSTYLLVGRKETDRVTEDTRLYTGVPEGEVSERVAELAQLESYAVVDVNARETSRQGVYNLFITVVTVTDGGNYILVGKKEAENATEETRLYPYIQEDLVSAKVAELAGLDGYALVDVTARRAKFDGLFDIYVTIVTVDGAAPYIQIGEENTANTHEETRLYQWIREDAVSALVASLAALGNYAVVDVNSSKTKYDGIFDVRVSMLSVNDGGAVTQVGKEETAYALETTFLYPRVKQSSVAAVINGTALAGYVRVGSRASRTRWDGVFDVRVTMRLLKAAAGATLIGSKTPGFIRRDVYLIRNVADGDVAGTVSGLAGQPLVEDVRSTRAGEPGYRDVFYTEMTLPAAYTESAVSYETSDGNWSPSEWIFFNNFRAVKGSDGDTSRYQLFQDSLPIAYGELALTRKVTVATTKTYSSSDPGAPAGSGSASGVDRQSSFNVSGGRTYQLPNGLWVSEAITVTKSPWS